MAMAVETGVGPSGCIDIAAAADIQRRSDSRCWDPSDHSRCLTYPLV